MLLCMIGTSKSTHLLVLNLHGTHVHKSYVALISTTSQLAGKDHVHIYMILVVVYHDTNENSKDPPFKGRDFAIYLFQL
jgi:hypothetical protein